MNLKPIFSAASLLLLIFACTPSKNISTNKSPGEKLAFAGRIGKDSSGNSVIYWPGSSVKTTFKGSDLRVTLKDERGRNTFYVIIDNDSIYTLKPDSTKKTYQLVSGLPNRKHSIELYKLNDWTGGSTTFYGFDYAAGSKSLNTETPKRHIEFYGNSITVGAGMLEKPGSDPKHLPTNNYLSYGSITARHFNAKYSCISLSGIGLMVSWGPLIMPEMYQRLNPADSNSKWNFSYAQPDIIVINLLQNDQALFTNPDHKQFQRRFGKEAPSPDSVILSYKKFIGSIRHHYPNAYIICSLGSMDAVKPGSPWPEYISKAVAMTNDKKIYTHFFEYINANRHPDVHEHEEMAKSLIMFISNNIRW
jgi:hypothetical protein